MELSKKEFKEKMKKFRKCELVDYLIFLIEEENKRIEQEALPVSLHKAYEDMLATYEGYSEN